MSHSRSAPPAYEAAVGAGAVGAVAAAGGVGVLPHGPLLGGARLSDPAQPGVVVVPGLAGGDPTATDPAYGPVDVEHLQHHLQPGPAQVNQGLQGLGGQRPVGVQGGQHRPDLVLRREGQRGEVPPDGLVLRTGQEQHLGLLDTPAGRVAWHNGGNGWSYAELGRVLGTGAMVFWVTNRVRSAGAWNLERDGVRLTSGVLRRLLTER